MAYREALSEVDVQKLNAKSALSWIDRNRALIRAKPNKTVVYAGRDCDLEPFERKSDRKDRDTFKGTPLYKKLENLKLRTTDLKVPADFETIQDVLTGIRDHPKIVDKDRVEKSFAHAYDCYVSLKDMKALILPRELDRCWSLLSEAFASNAKGDITFLDGVADDYGRLAAGKDLIDKELPALLRNGGLSDQAKELLQEKFGLYKTALKANHDVRALAAEAKRLLLNPKIP